MSIVFNSLLNGLNYLAKYPLYADNRNAIYEISSFTKIPFHKSLPRRSTLSDKENNQLIIPIISRNLSESEEIVDLPVKFQSNTWKQVKTTNKYTNENSEDSFELYNAIKETIISKNNIKTNRDKYAEKKSVIDCSTSELESLTSRMNSRTNSKPLEEQYKNYVIDSKMNNKLLARPKCNKIPVKNNFSSSKRYIFIY